MITFSIIANRFLFRGEYCFKKLSGIKRPLCLLFLRIQPGVQHLKLPHEGFSDIMKLNISGSSRQEVSLDTVDNLVAMQADMFIVRHLCGAVTLSQITQIGFLRIYRY